MIAQRFRSVVWVGGVALAALLLYIVSLQVATERGRLEEIDRQVASTQREIRQLQTEMGTRANLRQLERWNGDVLALTAPKASQYMSGERDISKINRDNMGDAAAAPPPVMAAVMLNEVAPAPGAKAADVVAAHTGPGAGQGGNRSVALSKQDRQVQQAFDAGPHNPAKPVDVALAQGTSRDRNMQSSIDGSARPGPNDGGKVHK
jgi:hypothetical protein